MEENQVFEGDLLTKATSFSQLLLGGDVDDDVGLDADNHPLRHSSDFSTQKTPKTLYFGNYSETNRTPQKSVITSCDSSSASCSLHSLSKSNNKKRNESVLGTVGGHKKTKAENPTGHSKRKEKLGERIAALQKLVSPFGKTDTASVLHEAMGYIRFLHEQVQVLCSPYLQGLPSSPHHHHRHQPPGEAKKELRSKGLCLIPVECTINVANSNGADFWLPAMGNDNIVSSSSTTKQ